MKTSDAFIMGQVNQGKPLMIFDWIKAAQIIKERKPEIAAAGLRSDWEWTGGKIWEDGIPVPEKDTYTYLASTWAVPELEIDGEIIECYVMEDKTDWDSDTYWPEEALKIVKHEA